MLIFYVFARLFIQSGAQEIRCRPSAILNVSIYIVFCMKNRMFLTLFYNSHFQKNRMRNLYVFPKISERRAGCSLFSTHFLIVFPCNYPTKFECFCIIYWLFIEIYHFFDPFFDLFWPFLAKTSYFRHWHFYQFLTIFWTNFLKKTKGIAVRILKVISPVFLKKTLKI